MADKSNTVSKKTIIAIVTVIVLLFIAGLSVGIFLADKGSTEAVDGSQSSSETQTAEENKANEDNTTANDNENTENNAVANNNENTENNTVANDNGNTENNTVANNNGNAENNTVANNNGNTGNNGNNAGANNNPNTANATNNTEVTTNTDVNQVGETTITRVEEQEKLVSRDFWDWWTPSSVIAVNSAVADKIIPQTPDFIVEKTATTGVGEDKLVYANKNITYTIKVTNNGEQELKDIEITDKVPEQTTFVSIDDAQNSGTTILKNDTVIGLKWIVTVPAKESIEVKFTVKVNENATGTISNAAIVNGKESNEEKTSIISAKKSSQIVERNNVEVKDGLEVAKLGDKIKYTITATNTGDVLGKTTIEDTIPVGTELIESSVTDSGKVTTTTDNRKQISWDVELDGNSTIERTFIVEVKDINGEIENVATVGGVPTNPDKKDTADIKVVKEVVGIKRDKENLELDAKVQAGDVIEYKITVTNTGSADLTNVVLDEKLVGIEIDAKDLQIGNLKAGEYKEIFATYTVSYEKDIKEKADRTIINNVEVTGETTPQPGKETEKVTDKDKTTTPVEEFQDVEVVKATTQTEKVKVGDTVNYTIKVKNTGNVTLTKVSVTDRIKLAAGDETLDIYSDAEYKNKVTEIAKLEVGEEVTLYAKYDVKQSDIDAQKTIINVATANGTDSNEVPVTPENKFGYRVEYYYENDEQDVQGAVTVDGKVFVLNETIDSSEDVTFGDIITDYDDKTITGYEFYKVTPTNTADPTKSALVITANEENNVIKVYYVKKTYTYKVEHYIQNLDGTWPNEPKDTDTINNVKYGDIAGYEENSYTGFTFDNTLTEQENGIIDGNGNITVPDNNNLVIKLYYTRNKYQYVVNYLKLGTNEVLHEQKVVSNIPFGTVITSSDEIIDIPGYNYHQVNPNSITIAAKGNVINIYYTENIRTAQIVEKSTTIRKTNLVLVLDLSSSMEDGTTRLKDAKAAANNFIDQIYNNKNISGINIKVVTFNTRNPIIEGVKECQNDDHYERAGFGWREHKSNGNSNEYDGCVRINGRWYSETRTEAYSGTQVLPTTLDKDTATNYDEAQTLKTAISNIYIPEQYKKGGYGTHIYAALQEANTQINNLKQEYANNDNVVVFLGDGKPTGTNYSGYGDNSIANIQSAAGTLKNNAVVYCIRLGNEAQNSTVFGDIATSSDTIIDANNEGELIKGFKAITSKENTRKDTANSSNGIITIEADLDTTKPIEVTKPDGTTVTYNSVEELNASGFISYNTANKTFTWKVLNYPNNITLNISYSVN